MTRQSSNVVMAEEKAQREPAGPQAKPAKNIIAVGSGKGGVGKSTVAVNLALALKAEGVSVAFLDADLYGPSAPTMFGVTEDEKPQMDEAKNVIPLERFGMKIMSIGFLVPSAEAVIWRGPMLAGMLKQFLQQVVWGDPEYLIVDLPPGTGDVQLSLTQLIPLSGAVVVTTPQDVALADVRRAVKMLEKTKVPILGIVENMAYFEAPDTGKRYYIFGGGDDKSAFDQFGSEVLAEIPLETATRESGDNGKPILISEPESAQSQRFRELAKRIMAKQDKMNAEKSALELPSVGEAYH